MAIRISKTPQLRAFRSNKNHQLRQEPHVINSIIHAEKTPIRRTCPRQTSHKHLP